LPFQYTFFVPQDIPGLIKLVGGRDAFIAKLDALFAGGHYDHGNEPSHHIAYLYDNAGAAWKTQQHVRNVLETQYADSPSGLAGNDDCGQMSAWYVMSSLGFYAVSPGTPIYQIGAPSSMTQPSTSNPANSFISMPLERLLETVYPLGHVEWSAAQPLLDYPLGDRRGR